MRKKHFISTDKNLNPELANEVATLRGGIMDAAEEIECNGPFTFTPHPDRPAVIITNTLNGNKCIVGLFAYREVRKSLNELI